MTKWIGKVLLGALLGLSTLAGPVFAGPGTGFNREGGFLGANATFFVPAFQGPARSLDFGNSAGFGLRGGYRYDEIFATEALYEFASDFDADQNGASARYRAQTFTVSGRLIAPFETVQPWISGGIGFVHGNLDVQGLARQADFSSTKFAGRVAAGLDLPLTDDVGLFVETALTLPTDQLGDFYTFALGLGVKMIF